MTCQQKVNVCDSIFSYSSSSLRAQVASLLHTNNPDFVLNLIDVHKQDGHNDYGVFLVLHMHAHPGTSMFEQGLMNHYEISCLQHLKYALFNKK